MYCHLAIPVPIPGRTTEVRTRTFRIYQNHYDLSQCEKSVCTSRRKRQEINLQILIRNASWKENSRKTKKELEGKHKEKGE